MQCIGIKDCCIDDGIALWPSSVEQKDAADDDEPERSGGNILRSRAEPLSPGAGEHPPTVTLQHPDLLNPPSFLSTFPNRDNVGRLWTGHLGADMAGQATCWGHISMASRRLGRLAGQKEGTCTGGHR